MPDGKQSTACDVDPSVRQGIHLLPELQELHDFRIHRNRVLPGGIIDGFQIVDALIRVVNVEKLMVLQQRLMGLLLRRLKILFTLRVADDHRRGVKYIQEGILVAAELCRAAAACQ